MGKELLVVNIVVEFGDAEETTAKSDRPDFPVVSGDGEDRRDGIVRRIRLDGNLVVGQEVMQDRRLGKGRLQGLEGGLAGGSPFPTGVGAGKPSERDGDVRVGVDEPAVEVAEA